MQKFAHVKCHKFPGEKKKIKLRQMSQALKKISEHTFTSQDFPWYLFFFKYPCNLIFQGSKVGGGQENDDPTALKGGKSAFTIFEDAAGPSTRVQHHLQHVHEDEPMQDQENHISGHDLVLHDAVVNFSRAGAPRRSIPLAPLELDFSSYGSEGTVFMMFRTMFLFNFKINSLPFVFSSVLLLRIISLAFTLSVAYGTVYKSQI